MLEGNAEVQTVYYAALDQNYITKETFEGVYNQAEKVSKLDSGLISYLTSKMKLSKKTEQTV